MIIEEEGGFQYSPDLIKILREQYGISRIENAKNDYVWKNKKGSVLSIVANTLEAMLSSRVDEAETLFAGDESRLENRAEQILNDPLAFIKEICRDSSGISLVASYIVAYDGLSRSEADQLIERALAITGKSRQNLEDILRLKEMTQLALDALNGSSVIEEKGDEDIEDAVKLQAKEMMKNIQPPDYKNTNRDN